MTTAKNKTIENDGSVHDYIANITDDTKQADSQTLLNLFIEVTNETPKMWGDSIIGFGKYHYRYASGREGDSLKIGFSARKKNLTIYIMDGFDQYEDFLSTLGKHKCSKSCLYINRLKDVDINVLAELVKASFQKMTSRYG